MTNESMKNYELDIGPLNIRKLDTTTCTGCMESHVCLCDDCYDNLRLESKTQKQAWVVLGIVIGFAIAVGIGFVL